MRFHNESYQGFKGDQNIKLDFAVSVTFVQNKAHAYLMLVNIWRDHKPFPVLLGL